MSRMAGNPSCGACKPESPRRNKVGPVGFCAPLFQTDPDEMGQEKNESNNIYIRCLVSAKREAAAEEKEEKGRRVMDFSPIKEALASGSFDKIADMCDNLMLQAAADGIAYQDEWPFAVQLLGHIYVSDINSARFLWKTIPSAIKESQPELVAVWKIGQKLWTRDHAGVYEAIRGFEWSPETKPMVASFSELYMKRMFELLLSAYSTISIKDTALFLGMNEDEATSYVVEQGWTIDHSSQMLTVKKQPVVAEQKLDPSKLQRLTEYVFHLEH